MLNAESTNELSKGRSLANDKTINDCSDERLSTESTAKWTPKVEQAVAPT